MGNFIDIFMGIFYDYWVLILLLIFSPYILYFLSIFFKKKNHEKKLKKEYIEPQTEEQIHLGIDTPKTDIPIYRKRIDKLISVLNEKVGTVKVNAVEAIMIVELFSDSVLVSNDGVLTIDLKTAKKFSEIIYNEPMKFIIYIKAVEQKIDLENKNNKIELGDVLYMMRNARKFGLYLESNDTDLTFKIKSAIHEANYRDVLIKIVNDVEEYETENEQTEIVLTNTYEDKDNENISELSGNENVKSMEILEDGKIKIITLNDDEIIKDDLRIYSVQSPLKEDEKNEEKKKEDLKKLTKKEDTTISEYITKFGELQGYERVHQDEHLFKDRAQRFFEEKIFAYADFKIENAQTENFFENQDLFYFFISRLFSSEHAMFNNMPYVYIGSVTIREKRTPYITIDIFYFLSLIYITIERDDRESFFNYVFSPKKNLIEKNINTFLKNINDEYNIFYPDGINYIFDVIYNVGTTTVKTKVIKIEMESFTALLKLKRNLETNYKELEPKVKKIVGVRAFGERAKKMDSDIVNSHDTFFRLPSDDRYV